jgi:hypothetical protein
LITAGAAGIGREFARAFAAAGAKVFVCDIDTKALDALGKEIPGLIAQACDMSRRAEIERMVPDAVARLGGLDVLINNAGISGMTLPVADYPPDDWDKVVAVNLTDKGLAYEAFMRPIVNPGMPTPLGFGYYLVNPSTGKAVEFDDCQQTTGTMIDYKDRYWKMLSDLGLQEFIIDGLWEQAGDQAKAAGSRPTRWYFSEKPAADLVRYLFSVDDLRHHIDIVYAPMPENAR